MNGEPEWRKANGKTNGTDNWNEKKRAKTGDGMALGKELFTSTGLDQGNRRIHQKGNLETESRYFSGKSPVGGGGHVMMPNSRRVQRKRANVILA